MHINMMNAEEIKKLWYDCYGEDLEIEYEVFYQSLKEKEKEKKLNDVQSNKQKTTNRGE